MEAIQAPAVRRAGEVAAYLPFRKAAVLGAGTMGAQIAAHLANAGLEVLLLDISAGEGNPAAIVEKGFKAASKLKPNPFFSRAAADRITLGHFEADFEKLAGVEWIIEAVVERMEVKRDLMARLEATVSPETIVTTNTSGLPIGEIAEGRSEAFRARFLGTHFFNPPRYLKLLELIPTPDTDPEVLERIAWYGRVHLGKGIVIAKDRPYFIGNRIGMYGIMRTLSYYTSGQYTIAEIDALTGPLTGRPKSATFRTADVVGLDVMAGVAGNLYEKLVDDEQREAFRIPQVLERLVAAGALGEKTKAGFYKKTGEGILSLNPTTGAYEKPATVDLGPVAERKGGPLADRLRALYEDSGRAGQFFRELTLDLLAYTARRIPEISDSPADVDHAVQWGFGWEMGPFRTWDALGFARIRDDIRAAGHPLPEWIDSVPESGFYSGRTVYVPGQGRYQQLSVQPDELSLAAVRTAPNKTLWENEEAALLDIGEGVALYEFRSKANALGSKVMTGLMEVIDRVEADPNLRGMVVGNEGANFSVGANLGEMAFAAAAGQFDLINGFLIGFQEAVQRLHYARKPVITTVHQRVLGGGCELAMACPFPVAAAETYIGLVELGVGLIPAGTGTMRLAALAAAQSPEQFPSQIQPYVQKYFENVAMARVAGSAHEAQEMGYLGPNTTIVMNADRRLYVARDLVVRLSNAGYTPPPVMSRIKVLGRSTKAALDVGVRQFLAGGHISAYDHELAMALAHVITGGDLVGPTEVHEQYLLDLEREVFLSLLGNKKTQERITSILMTNKPLRN